MKKSSIVVAGALGVILIAVVAFVLFVNTII